jgi:hypothetical protein
MGGISRVIVEVHWVPGALRVVLGFKYDRLVVAEAEDSHEAALSGCG